MHLVERFWAVVTTIMNVVTFSPFSSDSIGDQFPLQDYSPATNYVAPKHGPLFQPPGTDKSSDFKCDYSAMVGWEPCSSPTDRTCWLNKSDGSEAPFDIHTDYENRVPTGITRYYNLTISETTYDADGLPFPNAKFFNDQYPGPWIEACWGDWIVVNVTNKMQYNGTSVHWHGIRQNQTMEMDGVNGVTQCPIAPQDYFVYKFRATQYGSSWYHSHYSVQYADGAAGPLTLHGPTVDNYDEPINPPLIMTDWGHNSAFDAVTKPFPNQLLDVDILLNGRGNITQFNNTANTTEIQSPYTIHFEPAHEGKPIKKYLMRIINTSFQTTFQFSIDNHVFTVVEADFVPVFPYQATSILVGIGQRYDIIVEAWPQEYPGEKLPPDDNYWIRTFIVPACYSDTQVPDGLLYEQTGILRYNSSSGAAPQSNAWPDIAKGNLNCTDETYRNYVPVVPWTIGGASNDPPSGQDFELNLLPGNPAHFYPLATWYLGQDQTPLRVDYSNITFFNINSTGQWPAMSRVVEEDYNVADGQTHWVYLVIETKVVSHPIHLHGHDFAILDAQSHRYDPKNVILNLDNPPRRDVVLLPSNATTGEGYVVIAYKVDNPGAWLVHCHIAFHVSGGLGMQLLEDRQSAASLWPPGSKAIKDARRVCHNWDVWQDNQKNWFPSNCTSQGDDCFQNDSGV